MNRRYFFRQLASGLVAASAPGLFLPKLIKPGWKVARLNYPIVEFKIHNELELAHQVILSEIIEEFRAVYAKVPLNPLIFVPRWPSAYPP